MSYSDRSKCNKDKECERRYDLYLDCPIEDMSDCAKNYNEDFKNPTRDGNMYRFVHPIHRYLDTSTYDNAGQYLRSLRLRSAMAPSRFDKKTKMVSKHIHGFDASELITSTPELLQLLERQKHINDMFEKIEERRDMGEDVDELEQECIDENIEVEKEISQEKQRIVNLNNSQGVNVSVQETPRWITSEHITGKVSFGSRNYKVRTGPKGGKYIMKKGKKVYIK